MINRCLKRGETSQRTDDNIDVLKKRFHTLKNETMYVI
jgi:adenylate kinase family enzyme